MAKRSLLFVCFFIFIGVCASAYGAVVGQKSQCSFCKDRPLVIRSTDSAARLSHDLAKAAGFLTVLFIISRDLARPKKFLDLVEKTLEVVVATVLCGWLLSLIFDPAASFLVHLFCDYPSDEIYGLNIKENAKNIADGFKKIEDGVADVLEKKYEKYSAIGQGRPLSKQEMDDFVYDVLCAMAAKTQEKKTMKEVVS